MTLEEFRLQSSNQQVKHIDITKAPSYAAWYKAALAFAKRKGEWHVQSLQRSIDLNSLGFCMAYYPKLKTAEYARQVCSELGLKPKVNQGTFKGTDWDLQELYNRLPEETSK